MDEQWSDNDAPLIPPDAKFRQELARSLQDTHSRQRVQRQRPGASSARRQRTSVWTLLGAVSLLTLIFALGYYFGRRTHY